MNKKFDAILAKNEIARELKNYQKNPYDLVSLSYLVYSIKIIEKYLGEANQPSVENILKSKIDI